MKGLAMKRPALTVSLALILACSLTLGTLPGCQKAQTQEEFQEEYKKLLNNLGVYIDPEAISPPGSINEDLWAPDCMVSINQLLACIRAYELYDGSKPIPTYEEMKSLYAEYDESVYQGAWVLRAWYASSGSYLVSRYYKALEIALSLYEAEYGTFRATEHWESVEQMIQLENLIREHPELMPRDQYEEELHFLRIDE
jgi:hypothetical protein